MISIKSYIVKICDVSKLPALESINKFLIPLPLIELSDKELKEENWKIFKVIKTNVMNLYQTNNANWK